MADKLNVAVVGATGLVGRELLEALAHRKFPIARLRLFASMNTAGESIEWQGDDLTVEAVAAGCFAGSQLVFFCAHPLLGRDLAEDAVRAGAVVIDAGRSFRLHEQVPLVAPEVNPQALAAVKMNRAGIVASPAPAATALALALAPLERAFGLRRVVAATTHGTTSAGRAGFEEHQQQTLAIFNQEPVELKKFPRQTAFNIFPLVGPFVGAAAEEEADVEREVPKLLGRPELKITVTAATVPVFCGTSAAVNVETAKPAAMDEVRRLWEQAPGVAVVDDPEAEQFPDTLLALEREEILVGRLRPDPTVAHGLNFWISMDNLRKGAALNLVQIAEAIFAG